MHIIQYLSWNVAQLLNSIKYLIMHKQKKKKKRETLDISKNMKLQICVLNNNNNYYLRAKQRLNYTHFASVSKLCVLLNTTSGSPLTLFGTVGILILLSLSSSSGK